MFGRRRADELLDEIRKDKLEEELTIEALIESLSMMSFHTTQTGYNIHQVQDFLKTLPQN